MKRIAGNQKDIPWPIESKRPDNFSEQFLIHVYDKTSERIVHMESIANGYAGVLVTLLSATGAIAIFSELDLMAAVVQILLVILPILLVGAILMACFLAMHIMRLGGYLMYIEEKIQEYCSLDFATWERNLTRKRAFSGGTWLLVILLMLVVFGLIYLSIASVLVLKTSWIVYVMTVTVGVGEASSFIFVMIGWFTIHKKTYKEFRDIDKRK